MRHGGFTLVELMVCLAMAVLLFGMALPAGQDWLLRYQVRRDSALIYQALTRLRLEALHRRLPATLCRSTDQRGCDTVWRQGGLLLFTDADADGRPGPQDEHLEYIELSDARVRLLWRSFRNKPYLQMSAKGIASASNGTLTYCPAAARPELARRFVINRGGRVRVLTMADMSADQRNEVRSLCAAGY